MAVPIWNFCSKAFQSVSGHCIYLVNKKEQNLDFYTKFQIRNINRFLVKLFLVKESYTILRIACGRGRRPRRSPQRAKPSSLSAESEILIHRALRKGREQANSKLYASKQSGGLFWKRGRPAREGVPLRNTMA